MTPRKRGFASMRLSLRGLRSAKRNARFRNRSRRKIRLSSIGRRNTTKNFLRP